MSLFIPTCCRVNQPSALALVVCLVGSLLLVGCSDDPLGPRGQTDAADDQGDTCQEDCDAGQDVESNSDVRDGDISEEPPDLQPDTPTPPLMVTAEVSGGVDTPEGPILSGRVTVAATVTGGTGPLGVEFHVDDDRVDTDLIPPYTAVIDTAGYQDGVHSIAVYTADQGGETAFAQLVLRFDNSPPVFTQQAPVDGDVLFFEDGPFMFGLEVDDPEPIVRVTLRANGLLTAEFTETPFATLVGYEGIYVEDSDLPAALLLQHEATDLLGQVTTTSSNVQVMSRVAWRYSTVGEVWASPRLLPNGNVAVGNRNNRLTVLTPAGDEAWGADLGGEIDWAVAVDGANERLFVGAASGEVTSYTTSGGRLWGPVNLSTPPGGNLVVANDTVYVAGFSGTLFALNAANGSTRWTEDLPTNLLATPAVTAEGRVYVGCQDGALYAIDAGGEAAWDFATGDEVLGTPTLGRDGEVYFGSNDGWLYALDDEGVRLWSTEIEGQLWGTPLLTEDGGLIIGSTSRMVTRVDATDGAVIWSTRTEGITRSSVVADENGTLYIGTTAGDLFALSPETGAILWSYSVGDAIHGTPLVVGHRAYLGSTNRDVFAVRVAAPPTE